MRYGQNLIKQLGYRNVNDKAARLEPKGTIYDDIFASRVHKSKELAKKIDGTHSHTITKHMQEQRQSEKASFEQRYTEGGTLLEQTSLRRELNAPNLKFKQQRATADVLRSQMEFKRDQLAIEKDTNFKIQAVNEYDCKAYLKQERDIRNKKRAQEKLIEAAVKR